MHHQALQRLKLEGKLRRAIQEEQLQLHYQPIVTLSEASEGYAVVGFEALVRWPSKSEPKFISPGEFIPLAERNGINLATGRLDF